MAERVRRFRIVNPCFSFDVKGDVLTARTFTDDGRAVHCENPKSQDKGFLWCYIIGDHVEELPTFAVGDAVRVKAGSPVYRCDGYEKPPDWAFGQKLRYTGASKFKKEHAGVFMEGEPGGETFCSDGYLEPWNDAEHWDGSKWVAKKPEASTPKPAIVCLREDGKLDIKPLAVYESTNAAFTQAEEWAKRFPGKEYVVLQEKGSKRAEKPDPLAMCLDAIDILKGTCIRNDYVEAMPAGCTIEPDGYVSVKYKVTKL